MSTNKKLVTVDALKYSLLQSIKKIINWLPFTKTSANGIQIGEVNSNTENVLLGVGDNQINDKNIFEIKKDGKIYVLDVDENKQKSLQEILNTKKSIIINSQLEWETLKAIILNSSNFGTIIYLSTDIYENSIKKYLAGIYIVSLNANDHGNAILSKLATTSSVNEDLGLSVTQLEARVSDNEASIIELNKFKNSSMLNSDIEKITGIDIDGNGYIG